MKLKGNDKYTVFLELVHGCSAHSCSTRLGCNAYGKEKVEMPIYKANSIIKNLISNHEHINRIILFGRGDSNTYSHAKELDFCGEPKMFSNSIIYPYSEEFSEKVWKLLRFDSIDHIRELVSKKRIFSKAYMIVNKSNIEFVCDSIQILKEYRNKYNLSFDIQLNHYDARYDYNPSMRDTELYIDRNTMEEYLMKNDYDYLVISESEVTSFRDCRAFIIDAWGNVVPCFYLDRPFFPHEDFLETIHNLEMIKRPCDICLENQSDKWRLILS